MNAWWLKFEILVPFAVLAFIWGFAIIRNRDGKLIEAGWLTLRKAGKAKLLGAEGIPLGDWGWAYLPVMYSGDGHIMTVAPPGTGKSTTASIPSCLSRSIKSRFVTDPGGEITSVCIGEWRKQCDQLYVINPFGLYQEEPYALPQNSFDPMIFVDVRKQKSGRAARIIATSLIAQSGNEDGNTAYFKSQGVEKLEAYIIYGSLQGMTLPQIYDLISLPIDARSSGDEITCQLEVWEDMQQIDVLAGQLPKEANDLTDKYINSAGEFQAIFSTMRDAVKFLKEPKIRDALARNEVSWDDLKSGRTAISIVLPVNDWKSYAGFVRLAFMSAVITLQEGKVAPHRVHILLEEFPALGRLSGFSDMLATSRKRKAQIEIVIQNIGQLISTYQRDYVGIIPNFSVVRYKATDNIKDAEAISKSLGSKYKTIRLGGMLLTYLMGPTEILEMPEDRQIVKIGNNRPALLGQYPYWQKWAGRSRALTNPNYGSYPGLDPLVPLRYVAGIGLRILESIIRPNAFGVCVMLAAFIWYADPALLTAETYDEKTREQHCTWFSHRGVTEYKFNVRSPCAEFSMLGFLYRSIDGWHYQGRT